MGVLEKLDDIGKPAWLGLMIVSFIIYWPVGLAVLIYLIGSGRMGHWRHGGPQSAYSARWSGCRGKHGFFRSASTGNRAFDEYRAEALQRLEEEQREFKEFLDRLRQARDKSEFDQFMAERGRKGGSPPPQTAPEPQAS